jgi:hypothetical protein
MNGAVPLLRYEVLDIQRENLYHYQWTVRLNWESVYVIDKLA